MEFVAGVMVFPGGGVDDRDRNADITWFGPEPDWWAQRLGVDTGLAEALVCAAARETFEESGVLFAGPASGTGDPGIVSDASVYGEARARWPTTHRRSPTSCATRNSCCAPTCCARGTTGSRPKRSARAATTPSSSSAHCPRDSGPTGEHRNRPGLLEHPAGRARRLRAGQFVPAATHLDPAQFTQRAFRRRRPGNRTQDRRHRTEPLPRRRELADRVLRQPVATTPPGTIGRRWAGVGRPEESGQ